MKHLFLASILVLLSTAALAAISPDGSTLAAGASGSLSTTDGTWTIGPSSTGDSPILLAPAAGAAATNANGGEGILIEVANGGQLYANTRSSGWWIWSGGKWSSSSAPGSSSPPPSSTGMTLQLGPGSAGTLTGCPVCVLTIPASSGSSVAQWKSAALPTSPSPYTVSASDFYIDRTWDGGAGSATASILLPAPSGLAANFATNVTVYSGSVAIGKVSGATFSIKGLFSGAQAATLVAGDSAYIRVDDKGNWAISVSNSLVSPHP